MVDTTLLDFLAGMGVNAPFALIIWFLWRNNQSLEAQLKEAQQNERETLKEQLAITQKAVLKAGLNVE